VKEKEEWQA